MYTIITRNQCNFCDTVKANLENSGIPYKAYNVQDPDSKWVLTLMKKAGLTTVPQVFSPSGELVGGCKELQVVLIGGMAH